jgi:single stranded DNA-binding protein
MLCVIIASSSRFILPILAGAVARQSAGQVAEPISSWLVPVPSPETGSALRVTRPLRCTCADLVRNRQQAMNGKHRSYWRFEMGSSISVQITGFVGSDVVLKEVGEQRVASFSLAVNRTVRRHNGSTGSGQQQTLWVRVNAWNGLSDVVVKYVRKSSLIQVESSWMRSSAWIDKNGEPRVSIDIDANRIILLDRVGTNEQETERIPF